MSVDETEEDADNNSFEDKDSEYRSVTEKFRNQDWDRDQKMVVPQGSNHGTLRSVDEYSKKNRPLSLLISDLNRL